MDTNIAAWMIAGGPRIETHADALEREHLVAFRESQRATANDRIGVMERVRAFLRPEPAQPDAACCTA